MNRLSSVSKKSGAVHGLHLMLRDDSTPSYILKLRDRVLGPVTVFRHALSVQSAFYMNSKYLYRDQSGEAGTAAEFARSALLASSSVVRALGESRFRLIYSKTQTDGLKVTFEIGPPGKPEEFSLCVQGAARKKTTGSR